jgi:hypothetical protein
MVGNKQYLLESDNASILITLKCNYASGYYTRIMHTELVALIIRNIPARLCLGWGSLAKEV